MSIPHLYVGCDVSKHWLDIFDPADGRSRRIGHAACHRHRFRLRLNGLDLGLHAGRRLSGRTRQIIQTIEIVGGFHPVSGRFPTRLLVAMNNAGKFH